MSEVAAAVLVSAVAAAVAVAYLGFTRFRRRVRIHLNRSPDIACGHSTPTGLRCTVLGYPLEVDLITTFAYRWRHPTDERQLLDDLAAALRARIPEIRPAPFPLVRDRILPVIKRTGALPPPGGYRAANHIIRRPFDDGLSIAYVIEGQFLMTYITDGMQQAWNLTADGLHAIALGNLRERTRHVLDEIGGPRGAYIALDGYDATRLLVADLIIPPGIVDPILAIPHEHALLVRDRSDIHGLQHDAARASAGAPLALTTRLYRWTPDGPLPTVQPTDR